MKNRGRPSCDFVRPSPRPSSALQPPPPPPRSATKWPLIPPQTPTPWGRRGTWVPTWDSLGLNSACDQIWSAAVSPRTAPKTGKIYFFRASGPFRACKQLSLFSTHPQEGGTKGRKQKKTAKITPFSTKLHFLNLQRKIKVSTCFSIFSASIFFLALRMAPLGGTKGEKRKKNRSVFDDYILFEPAIKNKNFKVVFDFLRSIFLCWLGPVISPSAQDPSKNQ